jgi:hypothetical protein
MLFEKYAAPIDALPVKQKIVPLRVNYLAFLRKLCGVAYIPKGLMFAFRI